MVPTIMNVLARVAVKAPRVNLLHILPQLQHAPHASSSVGTPLSGPSIISRSGTQACYVAFCVAGQARTASLECPQLHAVCAQLARLAALALAAALLAGLQLPLQQSLLFSQLILCQTLVCPADQRTSGATAANKAILVAMK